ncbi:MAG: hypothetical protein IT379_42910 [Deltaproteobacteria bacterium]|nr:hypothetical protein [Deltaproteobacteria bacterium]
MDSGVDIIVREPDNGRTGLAVQVMLGGEVQPARESLAAYMARSGVYVGLLFIGRRLLVLRDTFREVAPQSIDVVGDVSLERVDGLVLPSSRDGVDAQARAWAYEATVERWLESLRDPGVVAGLAAEVRTVVEEWVLEEIRVGEIMATGPRYAPGGPTAKRCPVCLRPDDE